MFNNQKDINIAMIGCGYWGKNLARNFHEIGNLKAVCDPNPQTAENFRNLYDVPALSWEEVLADKEINAVALAVPAEMHYGMAIAAMEKGKHVYVEKPIALDVSEAEMMVAKSEETNLTLMVGHLLQYHPVFRKLKELVNNGKIGNVEYIYSNRLSLGKVRREENVLWSFAPHDISMVLALANEEPNKVTATGKSYLGQDVEDITTANLEFPNGLKAHIFSSWTHPFKEQRLVVIGNKGMLTFEDHQPWEEKLTYYAHSFDKGERETVPTKAGAEHIVVDQGEPLKDECQHFVDSIVNEKAPRTDGAEGLRVLKVLDAATKSLKTGT